MPDTLSILTGEYERLRLAADHAAIELDLGCGKGGYLLELARRFPDRLIIGADVMLGRLRKIKRKAERRDLDNVMLLRVEAWSLLPLLPDRVLDRIHILCPDPWPKARHRAHRLITSEFLGRLAGKLKATGVLHLATDNGPYLETMRAAIAPLASYREDREGIRDAVDIQTDFERGFAARGVAVGHLSYRREAQLV